MNFYLVCWLGIILGGILDMSFYGDTQRWWVGTVEEGSGQTDPTALGRTRVRIDGIHGSDISLNDLPYAQCILPVTGGGTSGIGENPQLLAGARVTGFFMDGAASQIPCVYGYVPHIAGPTIFQELIAAKEKNKVIVLDNDKTSFINRPRLRPNPNLASDNITLIWNFFTDIRPGQHSNIAHVYQPYHIAAMIGNFIHESGSDKEKSISTTQVSKVRGESSQGIAQWNPAKIAGNRLGALQKYATDLNLEYTDLLTQVQFVDHELRTLSQHNEGFFDTKNTEQATMHFMRYYLRPTFCVKHIRIKVFDKNGVAVRKENGEIKTKRICDEYFKDRRGITQFTDRFPKSKGGTFPSGTDRVRAGEEKRLSNAYFILQRFTQARNN